jgi:pyruvate dehydrogenase E2 component (dihydrolipoamide acetyltransferase)
MYTEEGVLTAWLRPAGTRVEVGEPIAEISTEKATFEIPAIAGGILHPIALVGTNLRVEMLMGYILQDGEEIPETSSQGFAATSVTATPLAMSEAPRADQPSGGLPRSSPAARRLAIQHGVDLTQIVGSGPGGRIVEADVLAKVSQVGNERADEFGTPRIRSRMPLAGNRRAVAKRLSQALATAASTTLTREVGASILVAVRQSLAKKIDGSLPYDALFIKLFAAALHQSPELNAALEGDSIIVFDEVHIGFAVAISGGLVVPVVRNADSAPLTEVARVVHDLVERARTNRLRPSDVNGGTGSISNLGNYGVDAFTPILNFPQSAILGIGRIVQRPVLHNGALTVGYTCILSLTFDHRLSDGVPAAKLLENIDRAMNDQEHLEALA